jgi:hypothetical protein
MGNGFRSEGSEAGDSGVMDDEGRKSRGGKIEEESLILSTTFARLMVDWRDFATTPER